MKMDHVAVASILVALASGAFKMPDDKRARSVAIIRRMALAKKHPRRRK